MDHAAILALNNAHAAETSWLTADRLDDMLAAACHVGGVDGGRSAFLIAFDQDADYDSPNFAWFRTRYQRFVYVDRVVTGPAVRRAGHARRLYAELFARAVALGQGQVGCEVNAVPPNPLSDAFHAAMGFGEVGRAELSNGKAVRYLLRSL